MSGAASTQNKKNLKTESATVEARMHQPEEEIREHTEQWMRRIYQNSAMSNHGSNGAPHVDNEGDQSDSSELSDPPDSDAD